MLIPQGMGSDPIPHPHGPAQPPVSTGLSKSFMGHSGRPGSLGMMGVGMVKAQFRS